MGKRVNEYSWADLCAYCAGYWDEEPCLKCWGCQRGED